MGALYETQAPKQNSSQKNMVLHHAFQFLESTALPGVLLDALSDENMYFEGDSVLFHLQSKELLNVRAYSVQRDYSTTQRLQV